MMQGRTIIYSGSASLHTLKTQSHPIMTIHNTQILSRRTSLRFATRKMMNQFMLIISFLLLGISVANAQVTVSGALVGNGSYSTLSAAFTAINGGAQTGAAINVELSASFTETAAATLNAGAWSSVLVYPTSPVVISGSITTAIIKLNGADNVTIDGRIGGSGRNITISNTSTTASSMGVWIASIGTAGNGATGNTIRNCNISCGVATNAATTVTTGIYVGGTSFSLTSTTGLDNDNNSIIDNYISKCRYGIVSRGPSSTNLNQNTVIANNLVGPASFGPDQIGKVGIFVQFENNCTISQNEVRFVGGEFANTTAGADRMGIAIGTESWSTTVTGQTNTAISVTGNIIHDIIDERLFSAVGIALATTNGGSPTNDFICSNIIYNVKANGTGGDQTVGIGIGGTHTSQVVNNSIYLYGDVDPNPSASATNNFGSGIRIATVSGTSFANLTLKNNAIHMNLTSSSAPSVRYYAISGPSNAFSFGTGGQDNNIYYLEPGNPQLQTGGLGTTAAATLGTQFATLAAWQAAYTTPQDAQSLDGNPGFTSTTDLHISVGSTTANNTGVPTSCTVDFDGETRNPTTPDIGADEYTPLGCTAANGGTISPSSINGCNGATVTLTSVGASVGDGITYTWEVSSVGGGSGFAPVTLGLGMNSVSYTTQSLSPGTYYYRLLVECSNGPVTGYSNEVQVTIPTALNGTYLIDNTGAGNYLTFADAIADLNCRGIDGPVVFNVTAGQTFAETSNLELVYSGTAVNTISFQKSGAGANPLIIRSGTSATNDYVLKLSAADYYTFDGVDFSQSGTSSTDWVEYGIWIVNVSSVSGAKNNTFKNGVITLSNTNTGAKGVYIQSPITPTSLDGTQSDNRFLNMLVQDSWEGYRFTGATTSFLDNGNEINTESGGTSSISNLGDAVGAVAVYGVFSTYQSNMIVQNTSISNLNPGTTNLVYGITMQTSASNTGNISNNEIYNITGGGTVYGVYISSADTIVISNNNIYGLTTSGSASSVRGIYMTATGLNSNVYSNRIYDIESSGITTTTAAGIDLGTGTHTVYNNMISDIKAPASTTTSAGTRGISVTGGTASAVHQIYNNTVVLNDVGTVTAYTSAALHNSSTTPSMDIRNNIFINLSDISVGTRVAAFWKTATTDNVDNNSNNNLYYAGAPDATHLIYYDGTNSADNMLAYTALAAIAPAEAASVTENTFFDPIVNGIIRPDVSNPTYVESGAQSLTLVSLDFEGDVRTATPDIGADEGVYTIQIPPTPDCAVLVSPADAVTNICSYSALSLKWSSPVSGGPVTLGYDVYFGTSPAPAFVANTSALTYNPGSLLPNTTYYWQIIPKNAGGNASGCSVYSFTTIDAEVTSTAGDTRCGPGTVNLTASGSGTFNWYTAATGGSPVFTGSTYSPSISTTTDYWVSVSSGGTNTNLGQLSPTSAGGSVSSSNLTNHFMIFNVLAPSATINSVTIYPTAAIGSNYNIIIQNSSLTQIFATGTFTNTVTGGSTPQVVMLNATLPAGTGYRLGVLTNAGMNRNTTGAVYPYTAAGALSITGNTFDPVYYYFFYDWSISSGCESPRQMVTGTVLPTTTYYTDADNDTYGDPASPVISCSGAPVGTVADNTDCNDANAAVYPGAAEVCNNIDDDCNGATDDGLSFTTYYADADLDNFGNAAVTVSTCNGAPSGYVVDNTDCNDANAGVNPAAIELCNSIDDDCDGSTDEGFDVDNDGFTSCNGDCDDNNNAIYPGAVEFCNGIDDDCDGLTDDNTIALSAPAAVSGTATACLPGIAGTATFSTSAVANATGYAWSVPAGMTITSGQGTTSISVAYTATAIQAGIVGQICVYANNACVNSASTCVNVDYQVAAPVTPNSISGPGKVCPGDVAVYSVAAVTRASGYTWSVPATMTIVSGQGTNVVSVQVNAGYTGGSITVVATNVCGSSPARSKSLTQNLPATPTAIAGQKEGLCNTTGNVFSIPPVAAATSYNWGATGATITGGIGTNSITADVATLVGSGSITVQAVNGCGTSLTRTLTISGAPARAGVISGAVSVCDNTNEAYSVATVAGAATYTWSVTANGAIATGQGTKNITVDWGAPAAGQNLNVVTSNACGSSLTRALTGITINNCVRVSDQASLLNMVVMPNPATTYAQVQFVAPESGDYRLRITDVSGRVVFMQDANAGAGINTVTMDLSTYASGLYTIQLNLNGEQQVSRMIIE